MLLGVVQIHTEQGVVGHRYGQLLVCDGDVRDFVRGCEVFFGLAKNGGVLLQGHVDVSQRALDGEF